MVVPENQLEGRSSLPTKWEEKNTLRLSLRWLSRHVVRELSHLEQPTHPSAPAQPLDVDLLERGVIPTARFQPKWGTGWNNLLSSDANNSLLIHYLQSVVTCSFLPLPLHRCICCFFLTGFLSLFFFFCCRDLHPSTCCPHFTSCILLYIVCIDKYMI